MLSGMALKFRWRHLAEARGINVNKQKPNLVISSGYQVCWEKFAVYFDVELREVPVDPRHLSLNLEKVLDFVDEYTIGIVGILGITYTGKFDDIKALDRLAADYNAQHEHQLVIHVDAASGGMFAPFTNPELEWDFRLENVVSINTSGHKYGLVYPGVGWVVFRDTKFLPQELVFKVSYLGGEMPTMAINFSRSASQIIGQYYNFIRFGKAGYREIHERTRSVALFLAEELRKTGLFEVLNDGENLPIVCYKLKETSHVKWTLYDLSDRLLMRGWQVPAYPLPHDMEEVVIQRYVCRADLGHNMSSEFVADLHEAIKELDQAHILFHDGDVKTYGFTH